MTGEKVVFTDWGPTASPAWREDPFETVMYMLDYAAEYDERNPGSTALSNFAVLLGDRLLGEEEE